MLEHIFQHEKRRSFTHLIIFSRAERKKNVTIQNVYFYKDTHIYIRIIYVDLIIIFSKKKSLQLFYIHIYI